MRGMKTAVVALVIAVVAAGAVQAQIGRYPLRREFREPALEPFERARERREALVERQRVTRSLAERRSEMIRDRIETRRLAIRDAARARQARTLAPRPVRPPRALTINERRMFPRTLRPRSIRW
jgi:hypothetical protein